MSQNIGKNMMLASSYWGEAKSFKLIPLTLDCPFIEGLYDPTGGLLVMIGREKKNSFHMLTKLDDNGDPIIRKGISSKPDKKFKEERKTIETYSEHYVIGDSEQEKIINLFAINADEFNYKQYMTKRAEATAVPQVQEVLTAQS